jgi:3-oxoacyl-[acyl-carrier protein] reductase
MGMLNGRVAVITGAGRGIGQAIATLFVREGGRVVVNDVDAGPAGDTIALCDAIAPGCAVASIGSVTVVADVDAMMDAAVENFGGLDILVNNAGITRDRMAHLLAEDAWDQVVDVSLKGTFLCAKSAARHMRTAAKAEIKANGEPAHVRKVVNFASTAALRGNPGQAAYTAAKMGVVGLSRTLAQEWGPLRIGVNVVAPGFTETRLTAAKSAGDKMGVPQPIREAMLQRIPFARYGDPEDIANVVLFFASPLSDYVTGQVVNVSGGMQIP